MYHVLYKLTNKVNGKFYIGVHSSHSNLAIHWDGYFASGILINRAKEKYGENAFKREILATFNTREEVLNAEIEILKNCLNDLLCYNIAEGGQSGMDWNANLEIWRERDPDAYYEHMGSLSEKTSKAIKVLWENPEYRKRASEAAKARWEDPKERKRKSDAMKEHYENLENCKRQSDTLKTYWANPENRKRQSDMLRKTPLSKKGIQMYLKRATSKLARIEKCYKNPEKSKEYQQQLKVVEHYQKMFNDLNEK